MPTRDHLFRIFVKDDKHVEAYYRARPYPEKTEYDALRKATIAFFERMVAKNVIEVVEDLEILGTYLYRTLFVGAIHEQFCRAYKEAKNGASLRVILEFWEGTAALASLPWEYLFRPSEQAGSGKGFFLATQPNLILSRSTQLQLDTGLFRDEEELRVLAVLSQPGDENIVEVKVLATLKNLASEPGSRMRVLPLPDPTETTLKENISSYAPHIVHFIGHARFHEDHGQVALIHPDDGKAKWVNDEEFADCFDPQNPPRLVILEACEGAKADAHSAFSGVAAKLVFNRLPAVIAMQYEIQNEVGTVFSEAFYAALGVGALVDGAVQKARRAVWELSSKEPRHSKCAFGFPVLYLCDVQDSTLGALIIAGNELPGTLQRCPTSGCSGKVDPVEDRFCDVCRGEVAACPKGHAYALARGICKKCGYFLQPIPVEASAGPAVSGALPDPVGYLGMPAPVAPVRRVPNGTQVNR